MFPTGKQLKIRTGSYPHPTVTPIHQEIQNEPTKMASLTKQIFLKNFSLEAQELGHIAFSKDRHWGPATVEKILL